jgi:hypothetical protein
LFSGQCIQNFPPILEKVQPIGQKRQFNIHMKGQFKMKVKFFFVSESMPVLLNKEFFRKYSLVPFLPLLVKFGQNSAKIRPEILSDNFIFLRPLLSFLAEISATWQY